MSTSTPQGRAAERRKAEGKKGSLAKELVVIIGVALVLSVLVRTFVAQAFYVPSSSMEDTLLIQDRILASKITTNISGVHRGEIVVFADPGDWLAEQPQQSGPAAVLRQAMMFIGLLPSDTGQDLVKRVIGVGGDHVVCCDAKGRVSVNGVALDEQAYLKPGVATDQVRFDITVPAGRFFVMGDNRPDSADSRYHLNEDSGTIPRDAVVGRVVAVVWPFQRWSGEPIPAIFENPALDAGATKTSSGSTASSSTAEAANPDGG